jgi:hypothetical protein
MSVMTTPPSHATINGKNIVTARNTIASNDICDASLNNAGDNDANKDASLDDSTIFTLPNTTKIPLFMSPVMTTPPTTPTTKNNSLCR